MDGEGGEKGGEITDQASARCQALSPELQTHYLIYSPDDQEVKLGGVNAQSHRVKTRQNSNPNLSDSKALSRTTSHVSARTEIGRKLTSWFIFLSLSSLVYVMETK